MKRVLYIAMLASLFVGSSVLISLAASENESHHPAGAQTAATTSPQGMMMQQGAGMNQAPCMSAQPSASRTQMMGMSEGRGDMMGSGMMGSGMSGMMGGGGMHGMMHGGQKGMMGEHMFFLDRVDKLGLSTDQVSRLKAIHVECQKENIRNAAEAKIARLELSELLSDNSWTLKDAEPLVRKVQKLEGDIHVRHLQAVSDARKVLTAEQLQQAHADSVDEELESLFQ